MMLEELPEPTRMERLFVALQRRLPTIGLSTFMFRIAEMRQPLIKNMMIRWFVAKYRVNLAEAEFERIEDYLNFNTFFTRALKNGARKQPLDADIVSSPADGVISQSGPILGDALLQVKGEEYTLGALLAETELAEEFRDGHFCTIYLAPGDYHRVHMPFTGRLRRWAYIPGKLYSVNAVTSQLMPQLFVQNERMVAMFDTQFGPMAVVMVGALLVGGLQTSWLGRLTPPHHQESAASYYEQMNPLRLVRGAELGQFHMGSTVILLVPRGALNWRDHVRAGRTVRVGEELAEIV